MTHAAGGTCPSRSRLTFRRCLLLCAAQPLISTVWALEMERMYPIPQSNTSQDSWLLPSSLWTLSPTETPSTPQPGLDLLSTTCSGELPQTQYLRANPIFSRGAKKTKEKIQRTESSTKSATKLFLVGAAENRVAYTHRLLVL